MHDTKSRELFSIELCKPGIQNLLSKLQITELQFKSLEHMGRLNMMSPSEKDAKALIFIFPSLNMAMHIILSQAFLYKSRLHMLFMHSLSILRCAI